ncbi:hypothetical protein IL972_00415 [Acinetobacter sp. FL51]|uniref:hypothetical protein n=1 Tax=Acinetobacter sp. FL51 TaxID=2777978 RepID=UPI0018E1A312|nr:hypothetical protein [Acinetobacter sp. FL51]MBI1450401.1 hypothetical protein [Acinetobacter sp. FL51]
MNTATVIHFPKPQEKMQEARNMYSDKFVQGYVMSSRLYRKEVYPFLSDAARNVYAELENRINGHNKESDFVSYSQLQGGELVGSRKMGRTTVSNALQELIKLGVITVIANGKQGMKSYRLNEISLKDRFTSKTSLITRPVYKQDQTSTASEPVTSTATGHTIDNSIEPLEFKKRTSLVDNSKTEMFSDSVKYHEDNKNQYSLRELASTYTIQTDLANQAKQIDPKLDDAKIMSELKNFAQWSVGREKTTAQGWMNYWIYRIQKLSAPKAKTSKPAKAKSKGLSDAQLNYFASGLCNFGTFASLYSNVGETQKSFEARINANLRKPDYAKTYGPYLAELGFVVDLGDGL